MNGGIEMSMVHTQTKLKPWLIKETSLTLYLPREKDESFLLKEIIFWSLDQFSYS